MFERMRKDPHALGFVIGFSVVAVLGLIVLVAWGILSAGPTPTLVPTSAALDNRVTVVPSPAPPDETPVPATPAPSPTDTPVPVTPTRAAAVEYKVQTGDTLFDIALAYGVSVETLIQANNMEGETIVPGQVLIIPPGPLPTPTPYLEGDVLVHTVSSGETLIGLAELYGVTVEAIQEANDLQSEVIVPGQKLRIPQASPTRAATARPWEPSTLEGNLTAAYPLTLEGERFTMHYQPDTVAARDPDAVFAIVVEALEHIEDKLDVSMTQSFDVYVAGSLFAPPDMALRGRSFSSQRRNFYLFDDTGTPDERRYIVTHELTHLVIWNTVGAPSSVMLHEGVAVYTGIERMQEAGFIPLDQFCAAYRRAGQLPRISGGRAYLGHIRDLDLYFAAGCFVEHLIDTYGLDDFKQVFRSGDYASVYGRTLSQLETEWRAALEPVGAALAFDPAELVTVTAAVTEGYDRLFADFSGTPAQMAAYRALDQARIAALQGRFEAARESLATFEQQLGNE